MSIGTGYDYLSSIEADGEALWKLAHDHAFDVPIPTCPGWTLGDLVAHVGGAHRWMSTCVSSGLQAQERNLPPAPSARVDLLRWFREAQAELLAVLSATPPDQPVWTPIRGALGSLWWRRKAAVEAAIHRWDVDNAVSQQPTPIDAQLALDGIDEYSQEFLPNMLPAVTHPAPVSSLRLSATDLDDSRVLPLIPTGDEQNHDASRAELIGSASDLLLWMWNRVADDKLTVRGNDAVVSWWKSLVI